jgi:hypothetical protein
LGYVDLQQRRREELAREKRGRRSLWQDVRTNPYLTLGVGFILGVLASWPIIATPDGYMPFVAHLPMILIVLSGFGVWRLRRDRAKGAEPSFGGEKQLLAAIQSAGGTMTPVEAALETSDGRRSGGYPDPPR